MNRNEHKPAQHVEPGGGWATPGFSPVSQVHKAEAATCLVFTVQPGGGDGMVWGIFFFLAHFGPVDTKSIIS